MRSRSSPCSPVINASATISAITPTATPSVEIREISEMNACLRLASRYRMATNSSKGIRDLRLTNLKIDQLCVQQFSNLQIGQPSIHPGSHQRKENDVADRRAV